MEKEIMARISDCVKRNGMFDKAKKEILEKVHTDEGMKRIKEQCQKLVQDVFEQSKGRTRAQMREELRQRLHRKDFATIYLNDFVEECLKSDGLQPDTLESIARAEFGLPPLNTNTEVVDMELSDGASTSGSASSRSTEIRMNDADDEELNGRKISSASSTLTEVSRSDVHREGSISRESTRSSTRTARGSSGESSRQAAESRRSTPCPADPRDTSPSTATYKDSTPPMSPMSSPRTPPDAPSPAHSAHSTDDMVETPRSPPRSPDPDEDQPFPDDDLLEGAEAVTPVSSEDD